MCGFVAAIGPGRPLPEATLVEMRDRLIHRGPDGAGLWSKSYPAGSISLAFRRLAIIDVRDVANQPMVSEDGQRVIVFNGEIYNYVELREELERMGYTFRTRGDTEVVLQAYQHWGDGMVSQLNGAFAFVIWDEARGAALVARDRFGEKPLFFAGLDTGGFVFGSEIKALLAHPAISADLDGAVISRVLRGQIIYGAEDTIFRGIRQFRTAHAMVVGLDGEVRQYESYWRPQYDRSLGDLPREEVVMRLREHLERAVAMRMRSDVPVTACLSGGLDSSTLVALISRLGRENGTGIDATISVRFPDDPAVDEGAYIDRVLARTGVVGHAVSPSAVDLARDVRRLHWHQETIVAGPSMYLEWSVMRLARELGYKVIIDGQGGDEVLAGYQIYHQAYQAELYRRGARAQALWIGWLRDRRLRRFVKQFRDAQRRISLRDSLKLHQFRSFQEGHIQDMIRVYGGDDLPDISEAGELRYELAINLMRTSLPSNVYSSDRNSMAHGIESRFPFLDYELVDFASRLPDWAYLGRGWSKYILRLAMRGDLPEEVLWRVDKVGFAAPQDRWLRDPGLRDWVEERIFDPSLSAIEGYDRVAMERTWSRHRNEELDLSGELWRWASAAEVLDMARLGVWREGGQSGLA